MTFSVLCAGSDEQLGKLVYNALETATGSFVLLYEWVLQCRKKMGPFLTSQEREKIDKCKKQVGKVKVVVHICNSQDPGSRGRRIRVQGHPQLHSKFKASLGYMRPCLGKKKRGYPVFIMAG